MRPAFLRAFQSFGGSLPRRLQAGTTALGACALALLMSGTAGVAPPQANETPNETASPAPVPYGKGVLWRIERAGSAPSHLFGTIHLSYDEIVNLPKPVRQAFDSADSASFEIEMNSETSYRWALASFYQNWKTLDADIGPDLYADVIEMAEPYGLSAHQLRKFKPWVIIFYLSQPPGVYTSRKHGEEILDRKLYDEAVKQDKEVYGLETVEEHVGVFADLSPDVQRHVIRSMVQQDRVRLRTKLSTLHEEMVRLYLERETGALLDVDGGLASGVDEEIERMIEERLLDQRNHLMVQRMEARLKEGNAFVAVGAGHLPGEEGILNLLAKEGYKLTRVY